MPQPHRILRDLAVVTYAVPELERVTSAWQQWLDYRLVSDAPVSPAQAGVWQTPAAAGRPCALLQPASGESVYLRFIATGEQRGYEAPASAGWTATEMLVGDPDALAARLADSPFRRLAGPGDLFPGPKAPRAMQVVGVCGELLYFTRILPGGSRYGMKQARSPVDRPFIVTISGTSTAAMTDFYGKALGMRIMEPMPFINGILAHACGVPSSTVFPTTVSPIPGRRFLVEMDECPPGLAARPRQENQLPPGMAMVTFEVERLDAILVPFFTGPQAVTGPPYNGRRAAVIQGAAGEWLELIERSPPGP
jgi:catechol 2,3-dioxygenase-like lactoylglutathione lyase family enzyme